MVVSTSRLARKNLMAAVRVNAHDYSRSPEKLAQPSKAEMRAQLTQAVINTKKPRKRA